MLTNLALLCGILGALLLTAGTIWRLAVSADELSWAAGLFWWTGHTSLRGLTRHWQPLLLESAGLVFLFAGILLYGA